MIIDLIIVIAAALLMGVYVSWRAGRIDRLHVRVDMAQAALDATLLRRSSVAFELATSGLLDPATSLLLAAAVHGTRDGDRPHDLAESDLTRALRAAFSQPDFRASLNGKEGADELLAEVEAAAHQVFLARKFYNDVVAATREARQRPLARVLRLSGRARAPESVPADIRKEGGVARMSDPDMVDGIIAAVSIPVMAKCRIGHFAEAQVLQAIGVDYIDESEVLTPADEAHHVDKWKFTVPFVCGATNLGEALRRIAEAAAMIRSKGEAGTGNVVEATRHMRSIRSEIARLAGLPEEELFTAAKELGAPYELVAEVARAGRLPVVLFTAGGIATPADAALMMQLGAEGVFVGSGIFKSGDPARRAAAIVKATTFHDDPDVVAKVSRGLGEAMVGINLDSLPADQHYASRGW